VELVVCIFLAVVLGAARIAVGLWLADCFTKGRSHGLDDLRDAQVTVEMDALARTRRLNDAFLAARRAMWEEALRRRQTPASW
jgi:hypothetical protein